MSIKDLRVIGLTGSAGVGKTTTRSLVFPLASYMSFADPLRDMLAALPGKAPEEKSEPLREYLIGGASYRRALQTLGTEWGRELIDPNIWTKVAYVRLQHLAAMAAPWALVVFDDVRFLNEAMMIDALGGMVIQLTRAGVEPLSDKHSSEAGIPDHMVYATVDIGQRDFARVLRDRVTQFFNDDIHLMDL